MRTTSQAKSGMSSMRIGTAGSRFSGAFLKTQIPVKPKTNYIFSLYAKGSPDGSVLPTLQWYAGKSLIRLDQATGTMLNGAWRLITLYVTSPEGAQTVLPTIVLSGTPTSVYVDSVRVVRGGPGSC